MRKAGSMAGRDRAPEPCGSFRSRRRFQSPMRFKPTNCMRLQGVADARRRARRRTFVLQVPNNRADAVPCKRLPLFHHALHKAPGYCRLLPGGSIDNFKFNHLYCRIHGLANESTLRANRSNRQDHCSEAVSCDLICSICFRTSSYSSSRAKRSIITGVLTGWAGSFFLVSSISLESSSSHFLSSAIVIIVSCSRYIVHR